MEDCYIREACELYEKLFRHLESSAESGVGVGRPGSASSYPNVVAPLGANSYWWPSSLISWHRRAHQSRWESLQYQFGSVKMVALRGALRSINFFGLDSLPKD